MNETRTAERQARYQEQLLADIVTYPTSDRSDLLAFRQAMYGPESPIATEEYIKWLYEDPIYRERGHTPFWLYRKQGRVEGHQGAVKVVLKIGEEFHDALWTMDLMVSPKYRLRGVGAVLNEVAFQSVGLSLGVEVSVEARKAFLRAGWVDTGNVPLYVRPLDAGALLGRRWQSPKGHVVGKAANIALLGVEVFGWTSAALADVRMEEVSAFDQHVDVVWKDASRAYPVIAQRDSDYLNWRFARFPEPGRYRLFQFTCGSKPIGYAVLRVGRHHGLPAGHIVDFLCAPKWTYPLIARCIGFFRRKRLKVVSCVHHNPVAAWAFSALGFSQRDSGWPLMLRARDRSPAALAIASEQRNWFITGGDSDLDRPREGTTYAGDHRFTNGKSA